MGQLGRALGRAGDEPLTALGHVALGSLWLVPLAWVFTWSTRRLLVATPREQRRRARTRAAAAGERARLAGRADRARSAPWPGEAC